MLPSHLKSIASDPLEGYSENHSEDLNSCISHELRTPLTSIRGVLRLLQDGKLGSLSEEGHQLLNIAIHNADRLIRLADTIDGETVLPMRILSPIELTELQLINDLYQAFDRQEFHLFYQPVICVETNAISGFEVLVQWQHPQQNWIAPSILNALIKKTGLIYRLGIWSLEQACLQLQQWQQFHTDSSLNIIVNLSPLQLHQPRLVQQVRQILKDTNIAPHCLKLQLTETALISNHAQTIDVLRQLKASGIQFQIDDSGLSYVALECLQDLPINTLKINRSFCSKNQNLSEMMLLLITNLGLEAIVEGIETSEEFEFFKILGCKQMQGSFFSAPMDGETASRLLSGLVD